MLKGLIVACSMCLPAACAGTAPAPAPKPVEAPKATPAPAPASKPAAPIDKTPVAVDLQKFEAEAGLKEREHFGYDENESRAFYYSNGNAAVKIPVKAEGEYEIVITASCTQAMNEFAKFKLQVDGAPAGEVTLTSEDPRDYKVTARLGAGERKIGIEFTNDIYKQDEYDRNLYVNGVKLVRVK